jgi:anti-sigma-K factor RskA
LTKEEFISSGILETYVLGICSPEEIKKVREMENLFPEIRDEIETIELTLMQYSAASVNAPSHELKNKIQDRIFDSQRQTDAKMVRFIGENVAKPNRLLRFAAAALIISLICSITFNFILTNKNRKTQEELSGIRNKNNEMAETMEELQTTVFEKNNELAMIMKPGSKMITLKGMENSPSSHAMIVWNPEDKMVMLNSVSLPPPPEGMQYQLWALMDGKTMNAGVFDLKDGSVMLKMQEMPPVQTFAVTLEKMGGSSTPTMNAMYLRGNV